jgi:hypothetical protein
LWQGNAGSKSTADALGLDLASFRARMVVLALQYSCILPDREDGISVKLAETQAKSISRHKSRPPFAERASPCHIEPWP